MTLPSSRFQGIFYVVYEGYTEAAFVNIITDVSVNILFPLQIGFLYLRYSADPKTLWTWYEPYIKDDEVW